MHQPAGARRAPTVISPASFSRTLTAPGTFTSRVGKVVRAIPRGKVLSYGEVAARAGAPRAARMVGYALKRLEGVPWWRVLAADGSISLPDPDGAEQRRRLEAEGVRFARGRIMPDH